MKLMIVNTFYFPDIIGGAEVSVQKLAEGLVKNGNEVVILCNGEHNSIETINGIKIIRKKFNNIFSFFQYRKSTGLKKILYKILDYYNPFNRKILKEIFNDEKPDILHTNNLFGISPVIWRLAKKQNIPIIHTLRDYFQLCPKANLLKKDGSSCKNCYMICKLYRAGYRKCSKNVNYVTAPSAWTLNKFLEKNYFTMSQKKVIYNAVDYDIEETLKIYHKRIESIKSKKEINFVYVGGLYKHKGIKWLIETFLNINNKNISLNIAGKGELLKYVKEAESRDKRIKYHGFLNENELKGLLRMSDFLVIPSLWEEPFGRVIIDAYKSCIPVIGSNIGGIPELIINNQTGFLIEQGNCDELAEKIELLEKNRDININMYNYIIDMIKNFDIENQIIKFTNCYNEIVKSSYTKNNK